MNEQDIIDGLKKAGDVVVEQAIKVKDAIIEAELHKDRETLIGVGVAIGGGLLISGALFWAGLGYLGYHFTHAVEVDPKSDEAPAE